MTYKNYIINDFDKNLSKIISAGFNIDGERTGVGTRCLFGLNGEYDISERFPILTKRKVAWKSFIKEVLWYISGSHSIAELEETGCGIWTPWKSDEFTSKHNLPQGSGGYIYGFNLIHFGANIREIEEAKRTGTYVKGSAMFDGFNQLDYVINTLRANPKSRQACFTFWRPDTNHMAILPACHAMYSFIVSPDENGEMNVLNCDMFQRSADWAVGVWANIMIASTFTYLIAQQLNMKPGKIFHSAAHCHIYFNALEKSQEYLDRSETPNSPIMKINKKSSIYDYTIDDFELIDYNPLSSLQMPIAV